MFTNKKTEEAIEPSSNEHTSQITGSRVTPRTSQQKKDGNRSTSRLSSDLYVKGELRSETDIVIEGTIDGDVKAHLLTIGEDSVVRGQIAAEEIIVDGRVIGEIRGSRVRLNKSSRVEGEVIHEMIAIESGAHFEGSVKRQENPFNDKDQVLKSAKPVAPVTQKVAPKRQDPNLRPGHSHQG